MKKIFYSLICASMLLIGLQSCNKDPKADGSNELPPLGTIIFHDNVLLLDNLQNQEVKALDSLGLEFLFNSQFAGTKVKPGDILVGAPTALAPYGFLRRVLSKTVKSDGTIRLETEYCSLADALKSCNVVETFAPTSWERTPEIDISYQTKFDNDQSELKLEAKYSPTFYLKLTKVAGSSDFKSARIGCDLNRKEEFDFSANLTLLGTSDKYKYTEQWKGLPIVLAGALWVFPYYEHESGFKGDIKAGLKLGFKQESVQTFYKDYENGESTPIQRVNTVVTPYTGYFDIDASAVGELYTEEKVGVRFYEVVGAEIGIKGVLNGTVTKESNKPLKKCLDISIETGMSVYASVFGQKLGSVDGKVVWYKKDIIPCLDGLKVTTANLTNIGETAASGGGSITDDSGVQITARGVCWTTGDSAKITDSHTIDGSGIGNFTSQITGLSPGTTFKVRAYAQTSENSTTYTYYGNQIAFTTAGNLNSPMKVTMTNGDVIYAHPTDNSTGVEWGPLTNITALMDIGTTAAANLDFSGEANTTAIVAQLTNNGGTPYAAKLCYDLVAYGYDDWYLPAAGELNEMYKKLGPVANGGSGQISIGFYWSSSEVSVSDAWSQVFGVGDQPVIGKTGNLFLQCRCVRR